MNFCDGDGYGALFAYIEGDGKGNGHLYDIGNGPGELCEHGIYARPPGPGYLFGNGPRGDGNGGGFDYPFDLVLKCT